MASRAFVVRLGAAARARIERNGLMPHDIRCVPAAAGGPKGLVLMPLDRRIFGDWLSRPCDLTLIGASIGAWRMAAAAHADPLHAIARLERGYVEDQNYGVKPRAQEIAARMRGNIEAGFGDWRPRPEIRVAVLTARATGVLKQNASRRAFAAATLANVRGRRHLARHLQRVVFSRGGNEAADELFAHDPFGAIHAPLTEGNAVDALLASGSIPLLCDPVHDIAGAPPGWYWDGGLIDYHLFYPYARLDGLTLYPHFSSTLTPGWLDKFLPWRKQGVRARGADWLSTMILIAPSPEFLATLPNAKIPDRGDFHRYGQDHAGRIAAWKKAIAECERFADEAHAWLARPDPSIAQSL